MGSIIVPSGPGKAALTHLVSRLNLRLQVKPRKLSNPLGPAGRIKNMRKVVTALVQHERLELPYVRGDESRGYVERLISEAIRFGDLHNPTMNLAKFWILDEALVPKLFKVLVPRYKDWPSGLPYTRMVRAPSEIGAPEEKCYPHPYSYKVLAVLELRGNPYPPLPGPVAKPHPGAIHNVLLEEARKEYFRSQSTIEKQAEEEVISVPVPGEDSVLPGHEHENEEDDSGPYLGENDSGSKR